MDMDKDSRTQLQGMIGSWVESFQDYLIKLDMKPYMLLAEISILPLNNVIIRPTKVMNRADKNWVHF